MPSPPAPFAAVSARHWVFFLKLLSYVHRRRRGRAWASFLLDVFFQGYGPKVPSRTFLFFFFLPSNYYPEVPRLFSRFVVLHAVPSCIQDRTFPQWSDVGRRDFRDLPVLSPPISIFLPRAKNTRLNPSPLALARSFLFFLLPFPTYYVPRTTANVPAPPVSSCLVGSDFCLRNQRPALSALSRALLTFPPKRKPSWTPQRASDLRASRPPRASTSPPPTP